MEIIPISTEKERQIGHVQTYTPQTLIGKARISPESYALESNFKGPLDLYSITPFFKKKLGFYIIRNVGMGNDYMLSFMF